MRRGDSNQWDKGHFGQSWLFVGISHPTNNPDPRDKKFSGCPKGKKSWKNHESRDKDISSGLGKGPGSGFKIKFFSGLKKPGFWKPGSKISGPGRPARCRALVIKMQQIGWWSVLQIFYFHRLFVSAKKNSVLWLKNQPLISALQNLFLYKICQ